MTEPNIWYRNCKKSHRAAYKGLKANSM